MVQPELGGEHLERYTGSMSYPQQPQYPQQGPQYNSPYPSRYYGSPVPPYYGGPTPPRKKMPTWAVIVIAVVVAIAVNIAVIVGLAHGFSSLIRNLNNYDRVQQDKGDARSSEPNPDPAGRPDSIDAAFDSYYTQDYTWEPCEQGDACTTLTAPSDWSNAKSDPIKLHLAIHYAEGKSSKGYLFINPGGPGGSGADYLQDFIEHTATDYLKDNYDIIGFDPRGVADSTPVYCGQDSKLLDEFFLSDPVTEKNLDESRATAATFAKACRESSGDILDHVDTQSVAHDLDVMRALVGDDQLDYLGFSYGTYIGSTYAAMFPKRVGRFVLDGAVDPQADSATATIEQSVGFENALKTYLNDCITNDGSCPFKGKTVDDAVKQVQGWLNTADTKPWPTSSGDTVNGITMMYGIITPLYSENNWPYLTQAFEELANSGKADTMMFLADTYLGRDDNGKYTDNSMESNLAVNCLDDPPTSDMNEQKRIAQELNTQSPTFGRFMAYGNIGCEALKQDRSNIKKLDYSASGAAPIVVVGTTGDPATPYQSAVNLSKLLESGVLLTYKGEGHTAYTYSNSCVANAVDDYLVDGTVPKDGTTCD